MALLPESWYAAIQANESTLPLPGTGGQAYPAFGITPGADCGYAAGVGQYTSGGTAAASASLGVRAGQTRQALFPSVESAVAAFDCLVQRHWNQAAQHALQQGDFGAFLAAIAPWYAGEGEAPGWPAQVLSHYNPSASLGSTLQRAISAVGRWLSPFTGSAPVTQPFGPTNLAVEPAYAGYPHFHEGIDFGVAEGTPVQSVAAGTVLSAGVLGGYGNAIEVDLGNGITTLYGHLSQILVQKGQSVAGGTVLGLSGNTGASTGPHLHFGVMQNGQWVDPAPYLYGTAAPGTGSGAGNADSVTLGLTSKSCAPWDIPCLERAAAGAAVGAAGNAVTSGFRAIFTSGLMTRLALGTAGVLALVIGLFVLANDATGGGVADAAKTAAVA